MKRQFLKPRWAEHMADIVICARREVTRLLTETQFDAVLSINEPPGSLHSEYHKRHWQRRLEKHVPAGDILCMYFCDTVNPLDWCPPGVGHIQRIVDFARKQAGKRILVHCVMGVSRSTAAAVIVLRALGMDHEAAVRHVKTIRPCAVPNSYMLDLYSDVNIARYSPLVIAPDAEPENESESDDEESVLKVLMKDY